MTRLRLLFLAAIFSLTPSGCTSPSLPRGPAIETTRDLITALRDAGAQVVQTEMLAVRPGLLGGQTFFLGAERIEVFEFESVDARDRALQQALPSARDGLDLWARGRLIVAYEGTDGPTIALLSGLLGDVVDLPGGAGGEPYPPAVAAAIGWLADRRGVDPGAIVVVHYGAAQWSDACLGLGQADEACAAVVTPGWRIVLEVEGSPVTLRSDELGASIRAEP